VNRDIGKTLYPGWECNVASTTSTPSAALGAGSVGFPERILPSEVRMGRPHDSRPAPPRIA